MFLFFKHLTPLSQRFVGQQPRNLITTVHENSVALTWTMTDRSGILHYEIEYGTRKIKTIITIKDPSTEFTITGL